MSFSVATPSRRVCVTEAGEPLTPVTIRFSRPDDTGSVENLARLDSARPPTGRLLVAEVGGALRAALSIDEDRTIADPFHPTEDIVRLLELRGQQMVARPARRLRSRRWLGFAAPAADERV